MRGWWLALVCCLALCAAHRQATAGEITVGTDASYPLSRSFEYLEDKDGQLKLDDILQPAQQARFRPVAQSGPGANFGLTDSAIWLRVTLRTSTITQPDWLLEVAYPPLDQIELYAPDAA
ncbi:MAG: 7TM-DISM domain-containing protein, partial [Pseudomonadota bacterium]